VDDTELYTKLLGITPPWQVARVTVDVPAARIDVWVAEAPGTKFRCAGCGEARAVYDRTTEQVWRHLDTYQCRTYVHARLPRTTCPTDRVRQIAAPWAEPRSPFTHAFEGPLLALGRECHVTGVHRLTGTGWDAIWGVLERAVARGLARKPHRLPPRLGVDEKAFRKRHDYESLVVDLDQGTVEAVLDERTQASLEAVYRQFTLQERQGVAAVAMDMREPYIQAAHAAIPDAARKIVFDKYHAVRYVTMAVDKVRRPEHKASRQRTTFASRGPSTCSAGAPSGSRRGAGRSSMPCNRPTSRSAAPGRPRRRSAPSGTIGIPRGRRSTSGDGTSGRRTRAWRPSSPRPRLWNGIRRIS
jgi:transposase